MCWSAASAATATFRCRSPVLLSAANGPLSTLAPLATRDGWYLTSRAGRKKHHEQQCGNSSDDHRPVPVVRDVRLHRAHHRRGGAGGPGPEVNGGLLTEGREVRNIMGQ